MSVAHLRSYGRGPTREDPARCAVEVHESGRGFSTFQCSRKRGPDGLRCSQHAKQGAQVPDAGGWGKHVLTRLQQERDVLLASVARLEKVETGIAQITAALAKLEAPDA